MSLRAAALYRVSIVSVDLPPPETPVSLLKHDIIEPVKAGMTETDRILREELLRDDSSSVHELMEHIGQFSGKRLRPALVHLYVPKWEQK